MAIVSSVFSVLEVFLGTFSIIMGVGNLAAGLLCCIIGILVFSAIYKKSRCNVLAAMVLMVRSEHCKIARSNFQVILILLLLLMTALWGITIWAQNQASEHERDNFGIFGALDLGKSLKIFVQSLA